MSSPNNDITNNTFKDRMKAEGWIFASDVSEERGNELFLGQVVRRNVLDTSSNTELVMQGTVLAHLPSHERRPPLWRLLLTSTQDESFQQPQEVHDVVLSELQTAMDMATKRWGSLLVVESDVLRVFHMRSKERSDACLIHHVEKFLLPKLCILAALEESLQSVLSNTGNNNHKSSRIVSSSSNANPPRYYTMPPHQYLVAPTLQQQQNQETLLQNLAPAALAQRIRQGAHLAWNYYAAELKVPTAEELSRRRSTRLPSTVTTVLPPQPVQRGGRVAMYLLELLQKQDGKTEPGEQQDGDEDEKGEDQEVQESSDEEEESEEEESSDEDDNDSLPHEDESDDNPYLMPTNETMLEWLGHHGRSMSGLAIQHAICNALVGLSEEEEDLGLHLDELLSVDRLALGDLVKKNTRKKKSSRVVLSCTSGDKLRDLPQLEVTSFARCKFALALHDTKRVCKQVQKEQRLQKQLEQQEALVQAELVFKERKAWAAWRFKSIHGGYAKWPTWMETVQSKYMGGDNVKQEKQNGDAKTAVGESATVPVPEEPLHNTATAAASVPATATQPPPDAETHNNDFELAKSLQETEDNVADASATSGTLRRTTRRGGASGALDKGGGVIFYGGQSNLTQKQLMDTIVRLLWENAQHPLSLMALERLVAEDVTNPIQRIRVVLGKLLWKRHLVVQWPVSSVDSDALVAKHLMRTGLWEAMTAPASAKDVKMIEPAAPEPPVKNETNAVEPPAQEGKENGVVKTEQQQPETLGSPQQGSLQEEAPPQPQDEKENADVDTEQQQQLQQPLEALVSYLRTLHQTELELRRLVLKHLTSLPQPVLASAGDERAGSLEAMDTADFDEYNNNNIPWSRTGHEYISKTIYRPPTLAQEASVASSTCRWYRIQDYCPSVLLPASATPEDGPTGGEGSVPKESREVERRMRFRAMPLEGQDDENGNEPAPASNETLILTQAQVHAGLKAAALEQSQREKPVEIRNPFANNVGANISLELLSDHGTDGVKPAQHGHQSHCKVVGYDSIAVASDGVNGNNVNTSSGTIVEHRILILPDDNDVGKRDGKSPQDPVPPSSEDTERPGPFWAIVDETSDGKLICRRTGDNTAKPQSYKIEQSDYHSGSKAFQACQSIVEYLRNHQRAGVFMEPVDPVALNIPDYFDIIEHPMDISTLGSNLEKGLYSRIPPEVNDARGPAARMLNGPFKDDVVRIFDNAMLFNPPNDWIHTTAASIKKSVLKKIEAASDSSYQYGAATNAGGMYSRFYPKKSVYVDEDSDVDMYIYESDRDDDDYGGRSLKRKRVASRGKKEDPSTRALEHIVRLQRTLNENSGLSGSFADIPIETDTSLYTLPLEWTCRHKQSSPMDGETPQEDKSTKETQELMELLALQREVEETERASLRRSTRSHDTEEHQTTPDSSLTMTNVEYLLSNDVVPIITAEDFSRTAGDRAHVETTRESMHESYYAKLFRELASNLTTSPFSHDEKSQESTKFSEELYGLFVNDSFPPYLGRVIPSSSSGTVTWEIRSPYAIPALRWVIRGLVQSGHLSEIEPLLSNDSPLSTGIILPNNVYHCDPGLEPFDILDVKEMQRRRRADKSGESSDESEEVELSEYERLRAERVARNAERLKALGLA